MAHHIHETPSIEEQFVFTSALKRKLLIGIVAGLAMVGIGAFLLHNHMSIGVWESGAHGGGHEAAGEAAHHAGGEHHGATLFSRIVANLWMNSVYFLGISVIGAFFMSYNYVAKAGWYASIKRVPEAFPSFIIVPAIILVALYLIPGTRHIIFHWTHDGIMTEGSATYDEIIANKSWYLNFPFFLVRIVAYFVVWYYLWMQMRKYSLLEDQEVNLDNYHTSRKYAKMFLIFFAVTSSTAAWDLSMSIDTHWFSTMFGWYHLASWHVSGLAAMMLTIILLKKQGYLKAVQMSTLHDLGKLMFGFSVFWTYLWFDQYLLIYYANLPEETIYFRERISGFDGRYFAPFMISLFLNFVFPFLILMARGSKRNLTLLQLGCWAILIGHWFDFYQMQMPGIAKEQGGIGLIEWGTTLAFACAFVYFIANQLSKANLIPKNHPFLEESLHHNI
jgi:hypothetical protein